MYVSHLTLHDFRSYAAADVALEPGVTAFIGRNGQGKTNLVEAIDYLSRLASHRVATDAPLVRAGAEQAVVRAAVVRDGRTAILEVELNPGRANRARINKSPLPRARELVGLVRTVVFSPEDLSLVKGDPSERRRFLDDLLVLRTPRLAGVRADYDRVLRQRNTLLKTMGAARRGGRGRDAADAALATLAVWDDHLARTGAELLGARIELVERCAPTSARPTRPSPGAPRATTPRSPTSRRSSCPRRWSSRARPPRREPDRACSPGAARRARAPPRRRDRPRDLPGRARTATTCCSPSAPAPAAGQRLPVKGYASHGESWSFALALRLASYDLLRADGDDPILILDDVFAELDAERRAQLAELVAGAEQVLVTAAVAADVPAALAGRALPRGGRRGGP